MPAKPPNFTYTLPKWSSIPPEAIGESELNEEGFCNHYYLEVIKNGTVVDKIKLNKEYFTLGRLDLCDILCEHPSLSRYHAVLQYSNGEIDSKYPQGFYLYDLNSGHGTFLNKKRLSPNEYVAFNLENMAKFGLSTRLYILHGPKPLNSSEDLKINLTHEQMKQVKDKYSRIAMKLKVRKELEEEEERKEKDSKGIDWGLGEEDKDGDEEEDKNYKNPFAVEELDESYFSSDPKKALKNYFDREGEELEYESEQVSFGKFSCKIRLPLVDHNGEVVYAEVTHDGKKKECIAMCALEACRILNAEGVLKQSHQESAKKKREKDWESADYYDSDDDTYLDRTGDVEKKRYQRMAQAGKLDEKTARTAGINKNKVHTFDSLLADLKNFMVEKNEIEKKLETCKSVFKAVEEDDLDSYIQSLKVGTIDTVTRAKMKRRLVEINAEISRNDKLMRVAKPNSFDIEKWKNDLIEELNKKKVPQQITQIQKTEKNIDDKQEFATKESTQINSAKIETQELKLNIENPKTFAEKNVEKKKKIEKTLKTTEQKTNLDEDEDLLNATKAKKLKQTNEEDEHTDVYESNPQDYYTWLPPESRLSVHK